MHRHAKFETEAFCRSAEVISVLKSTFTKIQKQKKINKNDDCSSLQSCYNSPQTCPVS